MEGLDRVRPTATPKTIHNFLFLPIFPHHVGCFVCFVNIKFRYLFIIILTFCREIKPNAFER